MGNIWSNLVIIYGRTKFSSEQRYQRYLKKRSYKRDLEEKIHSIREALWKMAQEGEWKKSREIASWSEQDWDGAYFELRVVYLYHSLACSPNPFWFLSLDLLYRKLVIILVFDICVNFLQKLLMLMFCSAPKTINAWWKGDLRRC